MRGRRRNEIGQYVPEEKEDQINVMGFFRSIISTIYSIISLLQILPWMLGLWILGNYLDLKSHTLLAIQKMVCDNPNANGSFHSTAKTNSL